VFVHDIILISDSIIHADGFHGKGNLLEVKIYTSQTIEPGTYTSKAGNAPFRLYSSAVYLNYTIGPVSSGEEHQGTPDGKVKVSKSGDIYVIDISATMDGKNIRAHYKGSLPVISY
jgi:hypothetical protein